MILTTPMPFQATGVRMIKDFQGRALLSDEPGLGKSLQFLAWADGNVPRGRPVVITCPAGIKFNWAREIEKHLGEEAFVAESQTPERLWKVPKYTVVNYNILPYWITRLRQSNPYAVCLDESHLLRNNETGRTVAVRRLVRDVPALVAATGTPVVNRPTDMWPVLSMLDPAYWGNYYVFAHRYGAPRKTRWGWKFDGCSNARELRCKLLERCLIRRKKTDVLKDLPPKMHNAVSLSLPAEAMKKYRAAERDLRSWLKANLTLARGRVEGEKIAAQNRVMMLKNLIGQLKAETVGDWVDDFLTSGERLILFVIRRDAVAMLAKRFKGCAVVNGDVTGRAREAEKDRFNGGETPLLIANIDAFGTGWSATGCSNVAFGEYPWCPDQLLQGTDRCDGINRGVKGVPTTSHYLSIAGTIEEKVCKALRDKQVIGDQIVDGVNDSGSLAVLDQVIAGLLD